MIRLITGGARSGKSTFAESFFKDKKEVVYIATSRPEDEEMKDRVKLHRENRPHIWRTFEDNYNLYEALGKEEFYLLDCITVLTSNIMFDMTKGFERIDLEREKAVEDKVFQELLKLIEIIREKEYNLNLVTNEIGCAPVPEHHVTRVFRDIQGRVNQRIAQICDEVYLVTCGIAVKIK